MPAANSVFAASALYKREPWLIPPDGPSRVDASGEQPEAASAQSTAAGDALGNNICFANSALIEEMENDMIGKFY